MTGSRRERSGTGSDERCIERQTPGPYSKPPCLSMTTVNIAIAALAARPSSFIATFDAPEGAISGGRSAFHTIPCVARLTCKQCCHPLSDRSRYRQNLCVELPSCAKSSRLRSWNESGNRQPSGCTRGSWVVTRELRLHLGGRDARPTEGPGAYLHVGFILSQGARRWPVTKRRHPSPDIHAFNRNTAFTE